MGLHPTNDTNHLLQRKSATISYDPKHHPVKLANLGEGPRSATSYAGKQSPYRKILRPTSTLSKSIGPGNPVQSHPPCSVELRPSVQ
jgi:hypothetical protein